MRLLASALLFAACSGPSSSPIDAAIGNPDAVAGDAPRPVDARILVDAAPSEVCSASGWCQVPGSPSYVWGLSVAPDGQPWTVAYGVRTKYPSSSTWTHFDLQWQDVANPFVFHTELYSVFAVSPTDVWVGGRQGYVGHFSGGAWQELRPAAPWPLGIWGAAADDVWVLYDSGLRYHWNGSSLVNKPTSQVRYVGAWGTASNDVWGFGETVIDNKYYPAIDHFDGTTWQRTVLPGFGKVIAFWSSSPTDLYAVINLNGTTRLMHGDGTTWTGPVGPAGMQVLDVWGRSANDVWVVGRQGAIAHYDGSTWTMSSSGTTKSLTDIDGTATTLWAAGDGVALRRP